MQRVLVVDDTPEAGVVVRTALRICSRVQIVGEATTSFSAVELARELRPDLVVLDLGLPDAPGRETYRRVCAAAPESRVVIYSAHDSQRDWYTGQGVAFVAKDDDIDDLVAAMGRC
jgi:DNA-binding NarL/FixJ family response regulator